MGLEGVEILLATEEAFEIEIPDEAAEKMRTPRALIDYVAEQVEADRAAPCVSHRSFNVVRRSLVEVLGVPRKLIRRRTPLDDLVPAAARRDLWTNLGTRVGATEWPSLVRPHWLVLALAVATTTLAIAFGGWLDGVWGSPFELTVLVALSSMIPLGFLFAWVTRPFRTCFPLGAERIEGLVRFVAAKNPHLVTSDPSGWTRERVAVVVRQIIIDQLSVADFDEDADFVEDLGIS